MHPQSSNYRLIFTARRPAARNLTMLSSLSAAVCLVTVITYGRSSFVSLVAPPAPGMASLARSVLFLGILIYAVVAIGAWHQRREVWPVALGVNGATIVAAAPPSAGAGSWIAAAISGVAVALLLSVQGREAFRRGRFRPSTRRSRA